MRLREVKLVKDEPKKISKEMEAIFDRARECSARMSEECDTINNRQDAVAFCKTHNCEQVEVQDLALQIFELRHGSLSVTQEMIDGTQHGSYLSQDEFAEEFWKQKDCFNTLLYRAAIGALTGSTRTKFWLEYKSFKIAKAAFLDDKPLDEVWHNRYGEYLNCCFRNAMSDFDYLWKTMRRPDHMNMNILLKRSKGEQSS